MSKKSNIKPSDYQGIVELLVDAVLGVTDLTGDAHKGITEPEFLPSTPIQKLISGIASFTNNSIKQVTKLVGGGLNQIFELLTPMLEDGESSEQREIILAILNGVVGDYLEKTENSLAIDMKLRYKGKALELDTESISKQISEASGSILLVAHGLCMNDTQWTVETHNHAEQLAQDFGLTPIYLHYNTGRHISTNGQELDQVLEKLTAIWPVEVEDITILAHSMGGLVSRSAYHYAQEKNRTWHKLLSKLFFLGTPHHGAPLEQAGNYLDVFLEAMPYAKPFARLGKIRSAGITDLRYGNVLDAHWKDTERFEMGPDKRTPVPLPKAVTCYTIAGTTGKANGDLSDTLLGDGLVYIKSALGQHKETGKSLVFAPERKCIVYECGHIALLSNPKVYAQLSLWMEEE